jgi:hypothetical protein
MCLRGQSMNGDVNNAGFADPCGQGDPFGPGARGNLGGKAVLPRKGIVTPESVKEFVKRRKLTHVDMWLDWRE